MPRTRAAQATTLFYVAPPVMRRLRAAKRAANRVFNAMVAACGAKSREDILHLAKLDKDFHVARSPGAGGPYDAQEYGPDATVAQLARKSVALFLDRACVHSSALNAGARPSGIAFLQPDEVPVNVTARTLNGVLANIARCRRET